MENKSQTAAEARAEWNKIVEQRYAPTWGTTALGSTAASEKACDTFEDEAGARGFCKNCGASHYNHYSK